ncbi:MAG: type II restriction endonuclease [Chloroflexota bacterium]
MSAIDFIKTLQGEVQNFTQDLSTEEGYWIVKGFIDVYKRIYAMPSDTKVVSKVLELFLIPKLVQFGVQHGYSFALAAEQNFYPDISFISESNPHEMYAIDIKSTYRIDSENVNGMTLGAFTGYFRDRLSRKNTQFPYSAYKAHLVLGVIYSRYDALSLSDGTINPKETNTYSLEQLDQIKSVIRDFVFFIQPKYRIASARPGSGNTRNIGSVTRIQQLLDGAGPFAALGEAVYDDYWMNYLNADMARKIESTPRYNNLQTYTIYKQQSIDISLAEAAKLDATDTGSERDIQDDTSTPD